MVSKNDDSLKKEAEPRLEAALPTPRLFEIEAVDNDDVEHLKQILASRSDRWKDKDKYGSTLVHHAAGKGYKECLKYMLENFSEAVSTMDNKYCQPLHYAAYNGETEAVQLLLDNKANINAKNKEGQVPLLAACLAGHVEIAKLLLDQHFKENYAELPPTDAANNTLLHMSVIGKHVMVKELLEFMRSLGYATDQLQELVSSRNVTHQTILHIAAMRCQLLTIQEYLSQLQLSVDADLMDKHQKTCGYYAQKSQERPPVMNQNKDTVHSKQPKYRQKNTLTLEPSQPNDFGRNSSIDSTLSTMSTLSKVTPGTDGVNVLGESVKQSVVKKIILNKYHKVEVRVLTPKEVPPEDSSLAVNRATDSNIKLELFGGLHGNILNKLPPPDCHLVAPIVMVRLGTSKPLMMKVTIPHAIATGSNSEIKLFTISMLGVPGVLEPRNYTLDEKNCIVTMAIDKQQIFVLTVIGKLLTHSRSFLSVNSPYRPPAIKCGYYVLCEPGNHEISVKVYCGIDLPITWKLLSEIKKQPNQWGTFVLSHESIDISYQCVKNGTGWTISNSPHTVNTLSILPSPRAELFAYPPVWEFKVFPRPDVKHVSEKITCELRIAAGKTKLASQRFHHDRPASYYSKQSTPVSAADPLLGGHGNSHGEQLGEQLELATPVQCGYTANVDSMEHNGQASTTIRLQPVSNGLNDSQETAESSV